MPEMWKIFRLRVGQLSFLILQIAALALNPACLAQEAGSMTHDPAETRFALLVGIDDYAQPRDPRYGVKPLKGPGNDVALMRDLLASRYRFQDDGSHIVTLTGSKATHKGIIDALHNLVENAKQSPGSLVLFYFSGHGSTAIDTEGITGRGVHQTLVAYDSRREGGTDILDDEINSQLEKLRIYTDKITLIFDSCHSGSVWKDVGGMTSKALPPNPFSEVNVGTTRSSKDVGSTIKPNGGDFSVIVAATADEIAIEDQVSTKDGPRYHGLLTWYLEQAVRTLNGPTYDQLAKKIAAGITQQAPSQHPQAEGDINRFFLGRSADRASPYIRVLEVSDSRHFTINAGAANGLQTGALIALYDKNTIDLSGDAGRLGNARVTKVTDFISAAELPEKVRTPVTTETKAVVITPFAPDKGMPVFLPTLQLSSGEEEEAAAAFVERLRRRIEDSALLSTVNDPMKAKVVVRWGCQNGSYTEGEGPTDTLSQPLDSTCMSGYKFKLVPPDQRYVLFDLSVSAKEDPEVLAQAIEARAKQENLRNLTNNVSSIRSVLPAKDPLSITLERLDVTHTGIQPAVTSKGFAGDGITSVKVGDYFRFKITNNSDRSLFVVVVWIGSGGGIGLYSPTNTGEMVRPGASLTTRPPLQAGPPRGLETYKVLATSKPGVDFRVLEQPGISKGDVASPLEWLLNQAVNTRSKDPHPATDVEVGDWTTVQRDIFVQQ